MPDNLKICKKCGKGKPATAEFFRKSKLTKDGVTSPCLVCDHALSAEWRQKNPGRVREIKQRYRSRNREHVLELERNAGKAAYWAEPEKHRAARTAWRLENPEKARASVRKWFADNLEYVAKKNKEWAAANGEKMRAYRNAWREKNPEKNKECQKKWQTENRDAINVTARNCRSRRRKAEGKHTVSEVRAIRKSQRGKCAYCRSTLGAKAHLDHIQPLAAGGSNWPSNLQWLCAPCNLSKNARDPIEFAQSRGLLI